MTNEEIKLKIRTLYENGESLTKLSKKYKISYNTVKSWKTREKWIQKKKKIKKKPKVAPKKDAPLIKKEVAPKNNIDEEQLEEIVNEKELNQRESDFCLYYSMSGNVLNSALKAGYSRNYARTGIYNLLAKDRIKKELKRINEVRYRNIMTNEKDVLMQYIRIAYADMGDYLDQNKDTGEISLKDLEKVDTRIIKEIKIEKDFKNDELYTQKINFKLEPKHPALRALGEHFSIFEKDNNLELSLEKVADFLKGLTPEKIEELLEKCQL